ncbi:MAG: hypothetical protein P1V51_04725 [Deltaproteobacteria bacterium]|nr:hypothetical protein [Deltaproteobacteria bacterium]
MRRHLVPIVLVSLLAGCSAVNVATLPSDRSGSTTFLSAGDIPEAYETLGVIQVRRAGVLLFGFWDVVHTDLQYGLEQVLIPEIQALGGDGAINVRFHQTQYLTVTKALFAFPFFFVPLPSDVVITAEVVKLTGDLRTAPTTAPTAPVSPLAPTQPAGGPAPL